ncbi:MAG: hypothetical protein Q9214_003812 [Letrouitia sp. 1 TL-2023]
MSNSTALPEDTLPATRDDPQLVASIQSSTVHALPAPASSEAQSPASLQDDLPYTPGPERLCLYILHGSPKRLQDHLRRAPDPGINERCKTGTYEGYTPLGLAIYCLQISCVELLLAYGADLETPSAYGKEEDIHCDLKPFNFFLCVWKETRRVNWEEQHKLEPLYEVFEFDRLVRNFPKELTLTKTVFYNPDTIPRLQADIPAHRNSTQLLQHQVSVLEYKQDVVKDRLGERIIWVHVPSTNKVSRDVQESLRIRLADESFSTPEAFCRWRFLPSGSVAPGDPLLKYEDPLYSSSHTAQKWKFTAIAFPCLVLRTLEQHSSYRKKVAQMTELFPLGEALFLQKYNQIHVERTLDEAYYPGLTANILAARNKDQVVTKVYPSIRPGFFPQPILLVSQLWIWRLDNFVVTGFQSGEEHKELNLDEFFVGNDPIQTISPDLHIGLMLAHCIRAFGNTTSSKNRWASDGDFPPVLNFFEIATAEVLAEVDNYMNNQLATGLDPVKEGKFIHNISDIRSELAMIQDVLNQQELVLSGLINDPRRDGRQDSPASTIAGRDYSRQNDVGSKDQTADSTRASQSKDNAAPYDFSLEDWTVVYEAKDLIVKYHKRIEKIDQDAGRISQVIQDKLNLKRAVASTDVANASIVEARQSKLLSVIVLGFTIITIIFTPLSFLTALFALDIDTLSSIKYTPTALDSSDTANPTDISEGKPSDVYPGGKLAGIFIGVEVLTIVLTVILTLATGYLLLRFFDPLSSMMNSFTARNFAEPKVMRKHGSAVPGTRGSGPGEAGATSAVHGPQAPSRTQAKNRTVSTTAKAVQSPSAGTEKSRSKPADLSKLGQSFRQQFLRLRQGEASRRARREAV